MKTGKPKTVRIRVEWGGLTSYVDGTHFELCWDGGVSVQNGTLKALYAIDPTSRRTGHFFQGHALRPLAEPVWRSRTLQGLGGIVMEIAGEPACSICVRTVQKSVSFTVAELLARRYLRWPVGAKYSGFTLCAMVDGEGPFALDAQVAPGCLDVRLPASAFKGAARYAQFVDNPAAWVAPGGAVTAGFELPRAPYQSVERRSAMILELRWSLSEAPDKPVLSSSRYSPLSVMINGRTVKSAPVYFRSEWAYWVEFTPVVIPPDCLRKGRNQLTVRNAGDQEVLAVMSAQLREEIGTDLQIVSAPRWLLAGDACAVVLRCLQPHPEVVIDCRGGKADGAPCRRLEPGEHRLLFTAGAGPEPLEIRIRAGSKQARVKAPVYSLARETPSWKIGGILQCENHDEASGEVEYAIRYTSDTQLGNYLQFRPEPSTIPRCNFGHMTEDSMRRWAALLKERRIYFSFISGHAWKNYNMDNLGPYPLAYEMGRIMREAAGGYLFSAHVHEYSRWIYGLLPGVAEQPWTMPDAARRYIQGVAAIEMLAGVPRQGGQAVPLMSYDYESGMDYIAVETMAMNTIHLYAAARGAARIFNKPVWGCHIATYWVKAPDDFTKLTLNWLNFYMTYAAGGNFAISEDGHFHIPNSDHQAGFHSEEPTRLREIIRRFYQYVHTHPRRGRPAVRLALAQGADSCEIISFPLHFCWLKDQIGHVWGGFGNKADARKWEYGDPERGLTLIDEWMPYWQDGQHIRHWFAGTPYGQFDVTPVWKATAEQLAGYRVLVFLGWNTMSPDLYGKLRAYVENGGLLFMAVPHLAQNPDRAFLQTMEDLRLVQNGDVRDLFGVNLTGPAEPVGRPNSAVWNRDISERALALPEGREYDLKALRDLRPARVELAGARVLIRESKQGRPLLTENRLGQGRAWLLTTWAYPGRPGLESLMRDVLALLGEQSLGAVRVEDPSREVAWYEWADDRGLRTVYLLNTDWTEENNVKPCRLQIGRRAFSVPVTERRLMTVTERDGRALITDDPAVFVESIQPEDRGGGAAIVHGHGRLTWSAGVKPRRITVDGRAAAFKFDPATGLTAFKVPVSASTRHEIRFSGNKT